MIIECQKCRARFKLDESRLTGKGARVRCRKCGESIVVLKTEAHEGAPPSGDDHLLDLRSVLEKSMREKTPPAPAPPSGPAGGTRPQAPEPQAGVDIEKLMATAMEEEGRGPSPPQTPPAAGRPAAEIPAAVPAAPPPGAGAPQGSGIDLELQPEEEISFVQEAPPTASPAAPGAVPGAAPEAVLPSAGFVMTTADSLDFLKGEYDKEKEKPGPVDTQKPRLELDVSGSLRKPGAPGRETPRPSRPLSASLPDAPAPAPREPERAESRPAAAPPAPVSTAPPPAAPEPPRVKAPQVPPVAVPRPAGVRSPTPRRTPPLKRGQAARRVRPAVVVLLLLFFAVAGGGAWLGFTRGGQAALERIVPMVWELIPGSKPAGPRYAVVNLSGAYEPEAATGRLFVVRGQVRNDGARQATGVRLRAALLDGAGKTIAEQASYAGNAIPAETLRGASRETIEAAMANRIGERFSNVDIQPGNSVPFMVVFFQAPEGIESFRVDAADVE